MSENSFVKSTKPRALIIFDRIIVILFVLDLVAIALIPFFPGRPRLVTSPSVMETVFHPIIVCLLFGTVFVRMIWVLFRYVRFSLGMLLGAVIWLGLVGLLIFDNTRELRLMGWLLLLTSIVGLWGYTRKREPR